MPMHVVECQLSCIHDNSSQEGATKILESTVRVLTANDRQSKWINL